MGAMRREGCAIIRSKGGVEALIAEVDGQATREALALLVLDEMRECAPAAEEDGKQGLNTDGAYVNRVCGKLKYTLRHLGDVDCSPQRKEEYLLRSLRSLCRITLKERQGRYVPSVPPCVDPKQVDRRSVDARTADRSALEWIAAVEGQVPSRLARLAVLMSLYFRDHDDPESLLNSAGEIDVEHVSTTLGCDRREVREVLDAWQQANQRAGMTVPRAFRDVYHRLRDLASTSIPAGIWPTASCRRT